MNNTGNMKLEIRQEIMRHAEALNRIADKYERDVAELFIDDCVTSIVTLIGMSYCDDLDRGLDQVKKLKIKIKRC